MIANSLEYLQANNQTLQIMKKIEGNKIFNDLKPIAPSDIVNLSLDILRILIQIHCDDDSDESRNNQRLIQDISESSNSFVRFADISIDVNQSNNQELKDVLSAIWTVEDKGDFISRILTYGENLEYNEAIQ